MTSPGHPYTDASRMEAEYARHNEPMLEWRSKHNLGPEADSLPWTAPDFVDTNWPVTHVVRDTWSTLGHHNSMTDASSGRSGRMAYRTSQKLPAAPAGKNIYLWIGFDVTAALKTGDNQFAILCERYHLNELGTGGLMGPVVLFREK